MADDRKRPSASSPVASASSPVAVVGVGALFPGSTNAGGFWRDILAGSDLIQDVPPTHWLVADYYDPDWSAPDKSYSKRGAFLPPVDFDTLEHGIPPSNLSATDPSQLLALIVAQQVLEDAAAGDFRRIPRERTSVILGASGGTTLMFNLVSRLQRPIWVKALRESGIPEDQVVAICDRIAASYVPWVESSFPGCLLNVVAGRIANRLDLGGTNCTVDAACAGSLAALSMGVNELHVGSSDLVIAGGVDTMNDIFMYMCFSKTKAMSRTDDCRPFSDRADGTMMSEGVGMLALRRLEDAERDGNPIYAILRGLGSSSDGRGTSIYAPRPEGQAMALRRAYAAAGYGPDTVELLEAHGTGTVAGDLAEVTGLGQVFGAAGRADRQWCALGSVKSQIGHAKAAAGVAGLFKAIMALHHKVLPPTIKVDRPDPRLGLADSPFYLNTVARPWIRGSEHPRRASVSSFGFGGTNFHATLEEYRGPGARAARLRSMPGELIVLSAASRGELAEACRKLGAELEGSGSLSLLAHRTQHELDNALPVRLAIVATDDEDLRRKLAQASSVAQRAEGGFADPAGVYLTEGAEPGQVAFLFPGQGSQYLGMGADLAMAFDEARAPWEDALALPLDAPCRLHEVVFPHPVFTAEERAAQEARLTATEWAQPALGAASLALLRLLGACGSTPDCVAGHSFGEITALHAAGVLDSASMLLVARRRGELMAEAARIPGAMLAVGASAEQVRELLADLGDALVIANHNAPRQLVLSGTTEAVERAEQVLRGQRLSCRRLPVATAFHSPVVEGARLPFRQSLECVKLSTPILPVYANASAAPYPENPGEIRELLAAQLCRPVRFAETIDAMYARGVRTFVEVGPGHVLTGLVGQCLGGRPHHAVNLDRKGQHGIMSLWHGLGRLVVAGVALRLDALWRGFAVPKPRRPAPSRSQTVQVCGAPYGRPYPPAGGEAALPGPNPPRPAELATGMAARPAGGEPAAPPLSPVPAGSTEKQRTPPGQALAGQVAQLAGLQGGNPAGGDDPWLNAFGALYRQSAEAHLTFQKTMAESHAAFLRATEAFSASLAAAAGSAPGLAELPQPVGLPQPVEPPRLPVVPPAGRGPVEPPRLPVVPPAGREPVELAPSALTPEQRQAPHLDIEALLLSVVAEKTGYPVEVLQLDLDLESGLGVDSIKRVEILSALRELAPDLPEIPGNELARLHTLGDVLAFLRRTAGADCAGQALPAAASPVPRIASAVPPVAPPGASAVPPAASPGASAVPRAVPGETTLDLRSLLLSVVAEKTGYPVEVLQLDLDLESGLGVDSIKRVEILSALQERAPGLPEVPGSELARLRTLGEIMALLERGLGGAAAVGLPSPPGPPAAPVAAATQPEPADPGSLERHGLREVDAPPRGFALPGLFAGQIGVIDDGQGTAARLALALRRHGVAAREVAGEVEGLDGVDGVIDLGGLRDVATVDAAIAVSRDAFRLARALARRPMGPRLYVTVQDTGGDFGLGGHAADRAWLAGLAGLARTAAQEWPGASVRAVDLERDGRSPAELAEVLARELLQGGAELEVGLHADGRRTTLESYPVARGATGLPVDGRAVLVASGGGRGITAAALVALARVARPRLLLLGRTILEEEPAAWRAIPDDAGLKRALHDEARARGEHPSPQELSERVGRILAARQIRATLARLHEGGAEAVYEAVDIRDQAAVAAVLARARERWGAITGIVHGAGVIADRLIADKTDDQFARVFETKVAGLHSLLAATRTDRLSLICLFSSVVARQGNSGQADYAMANEILSKVAAAEARRRGAGCVVRAIDWGPWDGGMVTPALAAHFASRGVPLIPCDRGAQLFVDELGAPEQGPVEIVVGPTPRRLTARPAEQGLELEVLVGAATHGFLNGHRIRGVPVVPVALVLEWFVRGAAACLPELRPVCCRELVVRRGIRLTRFDSGGHRLHLRCLPGGQQDPVPVTCELRGEDGTLHYSGLVEMSWSGSRTTPAPKPVVPPAGLPWPWPAQAAYDGHLFHGPEFHLLHSLERVSAEGCSALVRGAPPTPWTGGPWLAHPALLDGGLQLAILWGARAMGKPCLPTRVGAFVRYGDQLPGLARCLVTGRVAGPDRTTCGLRFALPDGTPIAEMWDVELHAMPPDPSPDPPAPA